MENTVVGVYDSYAQAQNAMNELLSSGFSRSDIQLNPESDTSMQTTARTDTKESGSGIGNFFRSLFGMDDDDDRQHGDIYSEAVRRGSCVLTVHADSDDQRDRATDIMNRYDPIDINERTDQWRSQGWSGYDESAPIYTTSDIEKERSQYAQGRTGSMNMQSGTQSDLQSDTRMTQDTTGTTRIPVVEEELRVGKRVVQRGGVRIFQHMTEKPVHESVQLREEHVKVERHAVDEPATEADMAAFKEGSMELRETAEEAVVSKTAHVVEEVMVGKEVEQRTEEINDTVRRTDVEVEQLGASDTSRRSDFADTTTSMDDSDYRTHWQSAYGTSGGRYEDYDAAYRYGSTMAGSERYKNYQWTDVEPQLRSDWETTHPESTWDKVKDAVRYGAERVSGRQQRH